MIHSTSVLMSASGTLLGGIGIAPHTPLPPLLTLPTSFSSRALVAFILLRHFQVGRAHQLLVHSVASQTVVLLRKLLGFRRIGGVRGVAGQDTRGNGNSDQNFFHREVPLQSSCAKRPQF